MEPERWKQVEGLYYAALEREPDGRAAFLDEACGEDEPLRREVESLLSLEPEATAFLDRPALEVVAALLAEDPNRPVIGSDFGPYEVLSRLGVGGMGEVYLARDPRLGRKVALKLLPTLGTKEAERVRRFDQEAHAVSALNHPNIITVFEIGQVGETHYMATEFVEGATLRHEMARAPMTVRDALAVAVQVADALAAAHAAGIVHRDVKPENIMVRPDGYVKVLDFGLAKLTEVRAAQAAAPDVDTQPGMVLGTARYMSPEQARGLKVDTRTDVFSLGVVVYEMVAGRAPFAGSTQSDVVAAILRAEPTPLTATVPEAPPELDRIVSRALCKDRNERYESVADMAEDLKRLRHEIDVTSGSTPVRAWRAPGRWALALAALIVVAIAIVLALGVGEWRARWAGAPAAPRIQSIAVLPLENLSGDASQDYFADGMTEALTTELAKIGALRVISRTSAMQYKGTRKTLPEIARELNVDAVVEGSVVRSGGRVRITAQLIRAATDEHLWAEGYERNLSDMVALQGEVARAIAAEVKVKLTPQERAHLASARPVSPDANDAYLKGLYYFNEGRNKSLPAERREWMARSVDYFERAIALDPDYAAPHAGIARAYMWGLTSGNPQAYPRAKAEALRAIELDDTLAEAHAAFGGFAHLNDRDYARAEREFRRAIELNPSYAEAHHLYAILLSCLERHSEAIAEIQRAEALDPLTISIRVYFGGILLRAREYDRAIAQFKDTSDLNATYPGPHSGLGEAYTLTGRYEEAAAEFRRALEVSEGEPRFKAGLAWSYAVAGRRGDALALAGELERSPHLASSAQLELATVYLALGDRDRAMARLERVYDTDPSALWWVHGAQEFDGLASDPRYQDLMRRLGFPG